MLCAFSYLMFDHFDPKTGRSHRIPYHNVFNSVAKFEKLHGVAESVCIANYNLSYWHIDKRPVLLIVRVVWL